MSTALYVPWKPQGRTADLLTAVVTYLNESPTPPTLGQVVAEMVRTEVVTDDRNGYRRVHSVLERGRMGGLIDWDALSEAPMSFAVPGPYLDRAGHSFEVWVSGSAFVPQVREVVQRWGGRIVAVMNTATFSSIHEYVQRVEAQSGGLIPVLVLTGNDDAGAMLADSVHDRIEEFMGRGIESNVHHQTPTGGMESWTPQALANVVATFASACTGDTRPERFAATTHREDDDMEPGRDTLVNAIEAAMAATGETTRASSLKAKIKAAIEEHGA